MPSSVLSVVNPMKNSTYSTELAQARLDALRALRDALAIADTPAEKRRAATAILKAPPPSEIDESLECFEDQNRATGSVAERPTGAERTQDSPAHTHPARTPLSSSPAPLLSSTSPTPSLSDQLRKLDIPGDFLSDYTDSLNNPASHIPAPLLAALRKPSRAPPR